MEIMESKPTSFVKMFKGYCRPSGVSSEESFACASLML